jgi:hypothetical protein
MYAVLPVQALRQGEVSEVVVKSMVIHSVIVVVGNEEHTTNEHFLLLDCLTDLDRS